MKIKSLNLIVRLTTSRFCLQSFLKMKPINLVLSYTMKNGKLLQENACFAYFYMCTGFFQISATNSVISLKYGSLFTLKIHFLLKIDGLIIRNSLCKRMKNLIILILKKLNSSMLRIIMLMMI